MNTLIRNSFFFICLLNLGCFRSQPTLTFIEAKPDQIKLEIDSVRLPPEMASFPIRVRLTNYTNKKALLVFKRIVNDFSHQKHNLYLKTERDTLFLGLNADHLILNKRSSITFNINGYYGANKEKHLFHEFFNFPKGKICYVVDRKSVEDVALRIFKGRDTILTPYVLMVDAANVKVIEKFSQKSMEVEETVL